MQMRDLIEAWRMAADGKSDRGSMLDAEIIVKRYIPPSEDNFPEECTYDPHTARTEKDGECIVLEI